MSVVNNLIDFMRLKDNSSEEFDDVYEEPTDYLDEVYESSNNFEQEVIAEKEYDTQKSAKRYTANKAASVKARRSNMNLGSGLEVCVIKPVTIEEARGVTETLLQNRAVVLNLEGLDVDIAQRIIDFTSGSCYAINGNLQKISNYIFIITPQSVEISGDFQDIFGGGNSEVSTI